MSSLDLARFYQACNPTKTLFIDPESSQQVDDEHYYIDFSSVRGGRITEELERTISLLSPDEPTCQLFTGHIGCGKSTELLRLKKKLEKDGFHVVYFKSSEDLVMADVGITDILMTIAKQVNQNIEKIGLTLQPKKFHNLLKGAFEMLRRFEIAGNLLVPGIGEIKFGAENELTFEHGLGQITAIIRDSTDLRSHLRQYLEPRTDAIIEAINQELLLPCIRALKARGQRGLVVIIDNLDRIYNSPMSHMARTQPEYLFVDRGEQLKALQCHLIYTIPAVLSFSSELMRLRERFGCDPKVLSVVQVRDRSKDTYEPGINLLRQMVLARAFPTFSPAERLHKVLEVFESQEGLDRVCQASGGHTRSLLVMIRDCLQEGNLPISTQCVAKVIRQKQNALVRAITDEQLETIKQVTRDQSIQGEAEYWALARNMLVFEYHDEQGPWFGANPLILFEPESFHFGDNFLQRLAAMLNRQYRDE